MSQSFLFILPLFVVETIDAVDLVGNAETIINQLSLLTNLNGRFCLNNTY
jgi:hypothetical protein